MKLFLLRILPWVTAVLAGGLSVWQARQPQSYPWPFVIFLMWFAAAAALVAWRRMRLLDALEKMGPALLTLAAVELAFLVAEQVWQRWLLTALLAGLSYLSLELLFVLLFAPPRYPVNGLSRLNAALVPVAAFLFAATLDGLGVFLRLPTMWVLGSGALFGACFLGLTSHPAATRAHRLRWAGLGGLCGAHIGFLQIFLPVGMATHGALAAFLLTVPARIRRYAYAPSPGRRLAIGEALLAGGLFVGIISTSRWI